MVALLPLPEPQTRMEFNVLCVRVLSYPLLRQDVRVVESCLLISDAVKVEEQVVQEGNVYFAFATHLKVDEIHKHSVDQGCCAVGVDDDALNAATMTMLCGY
eukprot:1995745-Pleurochrysis_carterae.AAC.1